MFVRNSRLCAGFVTTVPKRFEHSGPINNVLVLNCGSSSIKFQVVDPTNGKKLLSGAADRLNSSEGKLAWRTASGGIKEKENLPDPKYEDVVSRVCDLAEKFEFKLVGHRVVHGGDKFTKATELSSLVLTQLSDLASLAPLHNPIQTKVIGQTLQRYPNKSQGAVFDTSFHTTLPAHAHMYPVPREWYTRHKVRRYGFHGPSHQYVVEKATQLIYKTRKKAAFNIASDLGIVSCHLGAGCSVTASLGGVSKDTSMGFSPLEGLMMGQRVGDMDLAVVPYMADRLAVSVDEVYRMLNTASGFLGVAGTPDSRDLEEMYLAGDKQASLAIDMFCYRVAKYIAAYQVPLGRLDAIVFTGGIGEKSPIKRKKILSYLSGLGVKFDESLNEMNGNGETKGRISTEGTEPQVWVIPTDEELMIARQIKTLFV